MTTPLTIYRFGLRGNSANESIGKHRFRTKKHSKVNKSGQKMMAYLFGYWRPWVRVPPLRPFLAVLTAETARISLRFLNLSFICVLIYLFSVLSITFTKKFQNGFEVKFEVKGLTFMSCICSCVIGMLGGSATTVFAGDCSLVA